MRRKVLYVVERVVVAVIIAIIVMALPPPDGFPQWLSKVQVPVVIFVFICYIGKLLYDTLFYDHYWP
jgi:uncharacterized membrane protein